MSAGVLFGGALVSAVAERDSAWRLLPDGWGWSALYAAAVELGVSTVFYLPAGEAEGLALAAPAEGLSVTVTGSEPAPWRWELSTPAVFLCGPRAPGRVGGERVNVVDVGADVSRLAGPLFGLDARQLVDVLAGLERLLGVAWASSVGRTAERLILAAHPRAKGGTLLDRGLAMPEPATIGNLELPYVAWRRPLTVDERARRWVHVFDQNAQYLAAWGTVELGHGQPVRVEGPSFDPRTFGLWRVPGLDAVPLFIDGTVLPRPELPGREWFTTPTLARVWELAHPSDLPEIAEAWCWPRRSRFLREPAERINAARLAAEREVSAASLRISAAGADVDAATADVRRVVLAGTTLEAVKGLYRVQSGRFAMGRAEGSPWYRPDWAHAIRAQARTNLHRRLCRLTGHPFAITTDALAFLSDVAEPAVFARTIGLPVGGKLGEFHHAGSAAAELVDAALGEVGGLGGAGARRVMWAVDADAAAAVSA